MSDNKSSKSVRRHSLRHSELALPWIQCLLVISWCFWGCAQTVQPSKPVIAVKEWVCDPEADERLKAGDLEAGIERHLSFLKNNPANELALYHLGYAYGQLDNFELEVEYYEKAIRAGYQKDDLFFNLGRVYSDLREFEKAIATFQRGLAVNPKYSDHYIGLGLAYRNIGDMIQAEKFFLKSIELNPKDLDVRFFLSEIYVAQSKREKALEQVRQILAIDPDHPVAREYLKQLEEP